MNADLPILMYHAVVGERSLLPERETGAELYDLPAQAFVEQMQWLKESGHEILITFDDGEKNNIEEAFVVMRRLDLKGIFFVIVNRIGAHGYMDWDDLKTLVAAGMIVGSHSLSHAILTELNPKDLEKELIESKRILEENLKTTIDQMSIPRGFCNDQVLKAAYDAGYKRIFISQRPLGLKQFCYPRIAVKSNWTLRRFKQAVMGRTPMEEKLKEHALNGLKTLLGASRYNHLRSTLIKIKK